MLSVSLAMVVTFLAASAFALPVAQKGAPGAPGAGLAAPQAAPTMPIIYLVGDSTMGTGGTGKGTQGWGYYLQDSSNIPVRSHTFIGSSARSFTRQHHFAALEQIVVPGDFVIMQFGHNDGGTLTPVDNGMSDCPIANNKFTTTCKTTFHGVAETVQTYPTYLENGINRLKAKGANVIISTPTPSNPYSTGKFSYPVSHFTTEAQAAAKAQGAVFIDHGTLAATKFQQLGSKAVDTFYPLDTIHTSPSGAKLLSQTFVAGIKASTSSLKTFLK